VTENLTLKFPALSTSYDAGWANTADPGAPTGTLGPMGPLLVLPPPADVYVMVTRFGVAFHTDNMYGPGGAPPLAGATGVHALVGWPVFLGSTMAVMHGVGHASCRIAVKGLFPTGAVFCGTPAMSDVGLHAGARTLS
jgi:hypothetical protein